MRKRSRSRRFPWKGLLLAILLCVLTAGGLWAVETYRPGTDWADLQQVYGVSGEEIAVFYEDRQLLGTAFLQDGTYYLPCSMITAYVNSRIYLDGEDEKLLYTLPEGNAEAPLSGNFYEYCGEKVFLEHPVSAERDGERYLSLEYVMQFTDLRYSSYENPGRLFLDGRLGAEKKAFVARTARVRCRGGIKSPILTELSKGTVVTVLQEFDRWAQIRTGDGHIGYVQKKDLGGRYEELLESSFEQPVYAGVTAKSPGPVFLVWHDIYTKGANSRLEEMMEKSEGVTVISPTWFSLSGHEGGYTSIADGAYVDKAHEMGLEVWIRVDNFDKKTYTLEALGKTGNRKKLIDGLVSETLQLKAEGINVDFEGIKEEAGPVYVQFLRELSVACHKAGLVLSVDNYPPSQGRAHYNLAEQAVFADYVIIMGYDEHWKGSEAGSNASLSFTKRAIETALELVPKDKLIHAVPFFTQIWKETECTADTAGARHDGNSVYDYYTLELSACGMKKPWELFEQYGVSPQWQEDLAQYYGEYEADGGRYRIWVEDIRSMEEKMKLVSGAGLAGTAAWKLGLEDPEVWSVISSYLKK